MFEQLELITADTILGLMAAFRADPDARKVDLGVGVYRDARGETPILKAVHAAESALLVEESTKTYVGPAGNLGFNAALEQLVFGSGHPVLAAKRLRTVQTPGGCGALRLGADLVRLAAPETVVHVSTPTWANHVPLLSGAGLRLERYPYFDASTGGVQFAAMLGALEQLAPRTVVLLHASCHNPTGADLARDEWRALLELVKRRRLLPFLDMAYQGLGQGLDEDAAPVREFAAELPELLCAVSCSKNFGLYRERVGALHVLSATPAAADALMSQLVKLSRGLWSMPPDHGAELVRRILSAPALRDQWLAELTEMRQRVQGLRQAAVQQLRAHCPQRDFSFIARQRGMFSFLGITSAQVRTLREQHHIYMTDDSRINIAGLRPENLEYFARATAQVLAA
jgi:aspartate aminotransferase